MLARWHWLGTEVLVHTRHMHLYPSRHRMFSIYFQPLFGSNKTSLQTQRQSVKLEITPSWPDSRPHSPVRLLAAGSGCVLPGLLHVWVFVWLVTRDSVIAQKRLGVTALHFPMTTFLPEKNILELKYVLYHGIIKTVIQRLLCLRCTRPTAFLGYFGISQKCIKKVLFHHSKVFYGLDIICWTSYLFTSCTVNPYTSFHILEHIHNVLLSDMF